MDDGVLAPDPPPRDDPQALIERGRAAARECRRVWRWHWQRFWTLRWENALRRPSWRVEEESRARRRMREEVRRYAKIRLSMAAMEASPPAMTAEPSRAQTPPWIQGSLTKIHR